MCMFIALMYEGRWTYLIAMWLSPSSCLGSGICTVGEIQRGRSGKYCSGIQIPPPERSEPRRVDIRRLLYITGVFLTSNRHIKEPFPSVVLGVSYSKQRKDLGRFANDYITGTEGAVTLRGYWVRYI